MASNVRPLDQGKLSRILGSTMLPAGAVRFGGFGLLPMSIAAIQAAEKAKKELVGDDAPAGETHQDGGKNG